MSSPLTLLSVFTDTNYDSRRNILPLLDRQIKQLRNKLKTYPTKEKNLYDLLLHESVTKDYVLDAVNKLKQSQQEDERQLKQLLESHKKSAQAQQITVKLTEFSDSIRNNFSADISLEEKRTMLKGLSVKILACPSNYRFTCFIDAELTSDYDENLESAFYEKVKQLEEQHPEVNFGDLIDHSKQLPEDTFIGLTSNQIKKNLVTIERTSGCLPFHTYISVGE